MSSIVIDKQPLLPADECEEFVVDRILSHRFRNGRKEYLLAWKGYSADENTWVGHLVLRIRQMRRARACRSRSRISTVPI